MIDNKFRQRQRFVDNPAGEILDPVAPVILGGLRTWDEFLKFHASTLWQCDFFSTRVLTPRGFRDLFVLVFQHVGTRRGPRFS